MLVGGGRWPGQRHREQGGQNGTMTWHQGHGLLVGRGLPHGGEVEIRSEGLLVMGDLLVVACGIFWLWYWDM